MRLINQAQIDSLYRDAEMSGRLRSHYLMHSSHGDRVQRLLIALVKGSYVEPHCHELPHQWEMFTVIEGQLKVSLYSIHGEIINSFIVGDDADSRIVEFSPGDIHSVECLSLKALMLEVKEGPFDPAYAKSFPNW